MTDREKVIRGLEICTKPGYCSDRCPYYHIEITDGSCDYFLLTDALDLLREQEPRLMTLEELQAIGAPWDRNTPPYLFVEERAGTGSCWIRWMSWGIIHDGVRSQGTMGVQNYGSKWRVWNLQPTPEQMRDTPWEVSDQ